MNRRMQKKKDKKITEAINGLVFIAERREQQRQAAIQQFVKRCEALYEPVSYTHLDVCKRQGDTRPLLVELKRMGSNVNQSAQKVNAGAFTSYNFQEVVDQLGALHEELCRLTRSSPWQR